MNGDGGEDEREKKETENITVKSIRANRKEKARMKVNCEDVRRTKRREEGKKGGF